MSEVYIITMNTGRKQTKETYLGGIYYEYHHEQQARFLHRHRSHYCGS